MKRALLLVALTYSGFAYTQDSPIDWVNYYSAINNEYATRILPIDDDTYYLVGSTDSHTLPITNNHPSTIDPGSNPYPFDLLVLKYSVTNGVVWQRCFGSSYDELSMDAQLTNDGGLIILSSVNIPTMEDGDVTSLHPSDIWLVKIDVNGVLEWQKSYGGSGEEYAHTIIQTADNGYLFTGTEFSNDGDVSDNTLDDSDTWMVKTNATGVITWEKSFHGTDCTLGQSILEEEDQTILFAFASSSNVGVFTGNHGNSDIYLFKLNFNGNLIWSKNYGGSNYEFPNRIIKRTNGNYIIAGSSYSNDIDVSNHHGGNQSSDIWIFQINSTGNLEWENSYGGSNNEQITGIVESTDGSLFVSGKTESLDGDISLYSGDGDGWALRLNSSGELLWENTLMSSPNQQILNDVCINSSGEVAYIGSYEESLVNISKYNLALFKLSSTLGGDENLIINNIFPNPFKDELTMQFQSNNVGKLSIVDFSGKVVIEQVIESSQNTKTLMLDNLTPGSYILELECDETIIRKSVIKI